MKLSFHLPYKTVWGETLHAVVYRKNAGANERKINIPLTTQDGQNWTGEIQLLLKQTVTLAYHYELRQGARILKREWQTVPRVIEANASASAYFLRDQWRNLPAESWLYSSAVTDVFSPRPATPAKTDKLFTRTIMLRAQTARPNAQEKLYVCGSCEQLGAWNPQKALPLTEGEFNEWTAVLDADALSYPLEYKLVLRKEEETVWEEGPNRILNAPGIQEREVWVQDDLRPVFAETEPLRAAGTVLPVFSLRSEDGSGSGDFGDLKKLTDWAVLTGQRVLQLLPVNDTTLTHTWQDSYPYNAVSVYALHPLYADIRTLPETDKKTAKRFEDERQKLNALSQIDYEAVTKLKLERLKIAFALEGKKVLASADFRVFFQESEHWLPAYAMFCTLRERYRTADFSTWPQYAYFSHPEMMQFCAPFSADYETVSFWYYVQYILHTQLLSAAKYAREKGVILKGDIPIGVSPRGVEAWTEKALFNLDAQAGAPPDDFSATGQNWGFPTYNWDVMARDGYRWWLRRFTHMARYFDAYRIDHVLGFFRIWEIPSHSVEGLLGQFSPALPMDTREIEGFGLPFKEEYLRPYISEQILLEEFGDLCKEAKKQFLAPAANGLYELLPAYDTQRKIEAALAGKSDEKTSRLRKGLYALASNVLFVADRNDSSKYHPRVVAMASGAFRALTQPEKDAFTRLYNEYFFRRHNQFWKDEALKKLPALTQATRLLACAEDLGMIPACVPDVLNELQLLSLEIERMPKEPGQTFADMRRYPYLSVATPSTHDMSVLRGWWKETPALSQRFYNEVLGKEGEAPAEMTPEICEEILRLHFESPSMLALVSWQDLSGMDEILSAPNPDEERINVPANPRHYWRYRMPLTLEKLLQEHAFNGKIRQMVLDSKR